MSRPRKIHYNRHLPRVGVMEVNRIARYCGEMVFIANPPVYVRETREEGWVDCKKCLNRLDRELEG